MTSFSPQSPVLQPLALLLLCSCAASQTIDLRGSPTPSPLNGVWGGTARWIDADGDERFDRHELQFERRGRQIVGSWTHAITWTSGDGRAYDCSRQTRYDQRLRAIIRGKVSEDRPSTTQLSVLPLAETQADCPARLGLPDTCRLEGLSHTGSKSPSARGSGAPQLTLRCGTRRVVQLHRRLDEPVPLALILGEPGSLTGVWTWHHRSRDPHGDLKIEDEVWHLMQRGGLIEGYYDRQVIVRSGDNRRFVCNNDYAYRILARFRVAGSVRSGKLQLKEVGYRTRPGACETGKRILDVYKGVLNHDRRVIHLSWDKGAQSLYRR